MSFRFAIALPVAALTLFGGAVAGRMSAQTSDQIGAVSQSPSIAPAADTIVRIAAVTQEITQLASTAIVVPPVAETVTPPAASALEPAKTANNHAAKDKLAKDKLAKDKLAKDKLAKDKLADKPVKSTGDGTRPEQLASAAPRAQLVRAVGRGQTGTAAWYGGSYIGRRTSSGERLDTTHATAAHRSLPLNSLARVTNLRNGRSVVVRVTDRGPLDRSLLIDMSPRAADELCMKEAGLVPVKVEQVVEVPPGTK
jgi:rare lipoprotein A